jgi:hypothetical protein
MTHPILATLRQQLETARGDIELIEQKIVSDPPETSDQLLQIRELQNVYRGLVVSIHAAIDTFE